MSDEHEAGEEHGAEHGRRTGPSLRGHLPYFSRYAIVGTGNFMVDMGTFALCVYGLGWSPVTAKVLAYVLVTLASFFANKVWTFQDSRAGRQAWLALFRFVIVNVAGLAVSALVVWIGVEFVPPLLANLAAIAVAVVLTYTGYRYWVYRPERRSGQVPR